jgi:hypothetical protein
LQPVAWTNASQLDAGCHQADDARVIEYATVLAALSMLTTPLGGLQARIVERMSTSNAVAVQQAVVRAKAAGVAPTGARQAYAKAPYAKPALRFVYATAWISAMKHQPQCILAKVDVDGTRDFAIKAFRADSKTLAQLRGLHLTAVQAGTAFTAGFVSAC